MLHLSPNFNNTKLRTCILLLLSYKKTAKENYVKEYYEFVNLFLKFIPHA